MYVGSVATACSQVCYEVIYFINHVYLLNGESYNDEQARKLQDALKCLQFETMTYLLTDGGKV